MNWTTVCEAIRIAVANSTGLVDRETNPGFPVRVVEWANRKTAVQMAPGPRARLTLRSLRGKGVDETRRELDEGTDLLTTNITGSRLFTVSVRVESNSQEPGADAIQYTSLLRTRLRRRINLDALRDAGVALVTIERDVGADFKDPDGRWVSAAIVDVAFHVAENDTDTESNGSYVAKVQGAGEDDLEGVVLDVDTTEA